MTINEMYDINLSRAKRWHHGSIEEWSVLEWAAAMCGEAGECANAAKKMKRLESQIKSINEANRSYADLQVVRQAVVKEVADTIIYGLLVMARCGVIDPEAIIREVFNKKSGEYGFPEQL